jgi:regulator of protease activity HflC (stomatin/prohibitin superfamily)
VAIPFVERIAYKRSLKETTIAIHPQTAITKDNVHVQLDGAVYTKVDDAYKASYGIENPEQAVNVLAQSAMRKEVGNLELDQLVRARARACSSSSRKARARPVPTPIAPTLPGARSFWNERN